MLWCLAVVGNAHGCLMPNLSSSAPRGRSRASTTHSAGDSSRARRDFPPSSRESLRAYFVSGTEALMMALIVVVEDAGLKSRPSSRSTPWVPPRNFVRAATCARDSPRRVRATTRSACASSAFDVALKFKSSARAFDHGGFECAVNVRRAATAWPSFSQTQTWRSTFARSVARRLCAPSLRPTSPRRRLQRRVTF